MRVAVINYCHYPNPSNMSAWQALMDRQPAQAKQALEHGATIVYQLGFDDIKNTPFYLANRKVLDTPRGAGLWAWKPYIILMTMLETCLSYDAYIYLDVDVGIKDSIIPFAEITKTQDVAAIRTTYQQARFCKRDCSVAFGVDGGDYEKWYQVQAGIVAYANNCGAIAFLTDWLTACCNYHLISDEPSVEPNYIYYLDHRHDQALFTIMYHKYNYPIWPPALQAFTDMYPLPAWCQTEVEGEFSN